MGQTDISFEVAAILSVDVEWVVNQGYEALVVTGADGRPTALAERPLRTGLAATQRSAAAALALWNDHLAAAHAVFQNDESPNGSLWHAILHRREGDFSNSKYWLARAGRHPVYEVLGELAAEAVSPAERGSIFSAVLRGGWNAAALVDAVRQVSASNDPTTRSIAVRLQRLEWQALFCHCFRDAG